MLKFETRRAFLLASASFLPGVAAAQNSFLTPGGASVPGIVKMCLTGNVAAPCSGGPPVPIVTSVTPNNGTTLGGTPVTISGSNFTGATAVTFAGVAATSVVVVNSTTITAVTPAGAAGAVNVAVTTPAGTGTGTGVYTYVTPAPTVASVAPPSGTTAGGTPVTITGTNFTGATAVTFAGVAATSVVVVNATTITCVTPAGTAGAVNVAVTTPGGTGTGTGVYTYNAASFPPQVSGTNATLAADFVGSQYWASAASQANFAAFMTAIGGTYSRASSATYLQGGVLKTATSNTPRFPTDLSAVAQGLRLTGSATNLLLQSNTFSGAGSWGAGGSTGLAQNATGPDGVANSAWTFTTDAGGLSEVYQAVTTGAQSVVSMFVKKGTEGFAFWGSFDAGGSKGTWFNLTTGAVASANVTVGGAPTVVQSSPSITPLANGWFLLSLVNTGAINTIALYFTSADGTASGTPGNTSFAFGAQITNTPVLCDYIPTTTATVTQAADSFSFPFTQTTFSALVGTNNQNYDASGAQRIFGVGANAPTLIKDATHFGLAGGATITGPAVTSMAAANKTMAAGNTSNTSLTSNNQTPVGGAGAILSVGPTVMFMGSNAGSSNFSYGNIAQMAIWNAIVASSAEMQRLTT